ncbi:hypothetical protein GCM10023168_05670 [Fodinibacter luteus]|uniref:Cyclophilin-like domain-containing protein n=1 Tax=Fodinibacter luteus TaxID=552064 RepID=A0ABP8K0R4_9MICO
MTPDEHDTRLGRGLATTALVAATAAWSLVACTPGASSSDTPTSATRPTTATGSPAPSQPSTAATRTPVREDTMRIEVRIDGQRFQATLDDSAASRDLVAQLPLTLEMTDHGGVEKTGALPSPLSLDGQPAGADPDVGDVGYYAPGSDVVLYYGDQSYYDGIVVLGRLEGDAAERIADMPGPITATVAALDD